MPNYRKNTLIIDFSGLPTRPSVPETKKFAFECLKINMRYVKNFQLGMSKPCVYVEMETAALAEELVALHNNKFFFKSDGKEYPIPLLIADGAIEVKIYDLPPYLPNETVAKHFRPYGDVFSIKNDSCHDPDMVGIPNGVGIMRMRLKKAIPSYVPIEEETAYVRYRNQVPTCKHCSWNLHVGSKCSEVRKAQASSVNSRLTLANILKGVNPEIPLAPTESNGAQQPDIEASQPNAVVSQLTDDTSSDVSFDEVPGSIPSTQAGPSSAGIFSTPEAESEVNINKSPSSEPFHGFGNPSIADNRSVRNVMDQTDPTVVNLEEGWREVSVKRPGSPKLAEKQASKRQSRSKHHSK